jgi:ATP-dependent RNA circularization protein (DNA/RNA ligase family)
VKYPKIQTVYKRDPSTRYRTLLEGRFALPEFEYLADLEWVWTEKIDGTNVRIIWSPEDDPPLSFKGRTDKAQFPTFLYDRLQQMFSVDTFRELYPDVPMVLYGEGYGARIQKGGGNYIPDGVSFLLFDVMIGGFWLERENVEDIAAHLGIDVVPIVGLGPLHEAIQVTRDGFQSHIGSQVAEGLVMRPSVELQTRRGQRIITKVKHKDFV